MEPLKKSHVLVVINRVLIRIYGITYGVLKGIWNAAFTKTALSSIEAPVLAIEALLNSATSPTPVLGSSQARSIEEENIYLTCVFIFFYFIFNNLLSLYAFIDIYHHWQ